MPYNVGVRKWLLLIAALSLIAFGLAVNELAFGIREVPRHWWSALPLIALIGSIAALAVIGRGQRS